MIFRFCRISFALSALLFSAVSVKGFAADCSRESFNRFRSTAQKLMRETEPMGRALLTCPELQDDILIWLTFYLRQSGRYEDLNNLQTELGRNAQQEPDKRAHLLSEAVKGNYRALETAVASQVDSYHKDAEAILILARSQARDARFVDARSNYESYMRLKPDDDQIRIELAYTWLWAGDKERAEIEFSSLLGKSLSEADKESVHNGLKLTHTDAQVSRSKAMFEASVYKTSDPFTRRGYGLGWSDLNLSGFGRTYETLAKEFGLEQTGRITELVVSKDFKFQHITAGGTAGVVATKSTNPTFELGVKYARPESFFIGIGVATAALAKYVPLPSEYTDAMDSFAQVSFGYGEAFSYRFEQHQIEDFTPHQKHALSLTKKIKDLDAGQGFLKFRIMGKRTAFERPSPLFYSPYKEDIWSVGLLLRKKFLDKLIFESDVDLGIISTRQLHAKSSSDTYEIRQLRGLLNYEISDEYLLELMAMFNSSRREQVSSGYNARLVQLNLNWFFTKP